MKKSKTFFILMFLGALAWSLYLGLIISDGLAIKSWPVTEGEVIASDAKRIEHNQERYIIEIKYSYSVGQESYVGDKISNSNVILDSSERDLLLKQYKPNSKVTVYYNPQELGIAYLEAGVDNGIYILLLACIAMAAFSAVNLIKLFKISLLEKSE